MADKVIKFPKGKNTRRVRSIDPYMAFTPFVMRQRVDSTNFFSDELDTEAADRYLHKKRAEGLRGVGMLHLFIAAYVRTMSQYPALNRCIIGQRVYTRKDVEYVMSVKKELTSEGLETSIKVKFDVRDTLEDVYNKLNAAVDAAKNDAGGTSTDKVAALMAHLPRPIFNFAIWVFKVLDYFNALPQFLLDASPFHGSVIITDMGSLGLPPVYHHIYNFGNLPVFIGLGMKKRGYELDKNGNVRERHYLKYTVVSDERICDGYYYAQGFKTMRNLLKFPEQLDSPPAEVKEDIY